MIGVNLQVDGYTPHTGEELKAFLVSVRPGYFNTLGIPFLQGRDFTPQDSPSPLLVVVNQSLARHYFGDQDPVGRHIQFEEGGRRFQIVGVVTNSKYFNLREETPDLVYLDSLQGSLFSSVSAALSVRVAGREGPLRNELAGIIRSLDPSVRIARIATLRERIDDSLHTDRLIAALCAILSLLALTLTGVGLYGILAFSVARRTSEIGIRMALGARRENVFRLIVGQGMKLVFFGLIIGSAAALASAGLLKSLLFGVGRGDPLTFLGICLVLAAAAALACYVPARRATQVDPMVALRNE
jgi:predicted permease